MGNWRKSTYSDANGGDCVELASDSGTVMVRDTTNRDGEALTFTAAAWGTFLGRLGA
jgi:Domain of unknown function (DUF397)